MSTSRTVKQRMAENTGHHARQRQVQGHVLYGWQSGQLDVEESVLNGSWKHRAEVRFVTYQHKNYTLTVRVRVVTCSNCCHTLYH